MTTKIVCDDTRYKAIATLTDDGAAIRDKAPISSLDFERCFGVKPKTPVIITNITGPRDPHSDKWKLVVEYDQATVGVEAV